MDRRLFPFLVVGCLPTLPGCLDGPETPVYAGEAFQASIHAGSDVLQFELDGTVDVLDRDGVYRPAYRLAFTDPGGPSEVYYDGTFRTVAQVTRDDDGTQIFSYLRRGALPALGLGLPKAVPAGSGGFVSPHQGDEQVIAARTDIDGHDFISVIPPGLDSFQAVRAGTYRFRADRLIAHQNPYGTVVDYESKGPLAIIPAWPLEWSTPAPAGGLPFPGAESDPTGNDVAAGPILAELRRQDAQLDQDLAAGACVAEFHLLFNATRTTVDLPTGPVVTEVIHAGWLVVQTATGHVRRNFEVRVPPIGDRTVTSTGSQPTTASPCAGLPAPATPVDDAYSWATRFGVEEAESLWYLADGRRNETRGAQVYQFQGRDGAQVLVDAHRGWLVEAKGLTDAQLQAIVQA